MLIRRISGLLFFAILIGCQAKNGTRESIEAVLSYQYPEPVLVTSDGKKYLLKTRAEDGFSLFVESFDNNSSIILPKSDFTQLSLRWGSAGDRIVYQKFNPDKMGYDVFQYDLLQQKEKRIAVPFSYSALPPLEIHPSDSLLAYVSSAGETLLNIVAFDHSVAAYQVAAVSLFSDFAWTEDGILLYVNQGLNEVHRFNPADRSDAVLFAADKLEILNINIGEKEALFMAVREKNTPYTKGLIIRGNARQELKLDNNIVAVFPYKDDQMVVETNLGGIKRTVVLNRHHKVVETFDHCSINRIREDQIFMIKSDFYQPSSMLWAKGEERKSFFQKELITETFQLEHLIIKDYLPVYFWKPKLKKNICFIDVHGGPHLHTQPYWDAAKSFLCSRGATVLAPNYRGSSAYTQDYESNTSPAVQVKDINELVTYAVDVLQFQKEEIFFIGRSYGASIVQQYLLEHSKDQFGGWVILGGSLYPEKQLPLNFSKPLLAYYGQFDHQNFKMVQYLQSLNSKKIRLHILKNEGHHFHHTRSQIMLYTAMYESYF